jgi:hypothetical protein
VDTDGELLASTSVDRNDPKKKKQPSTSTLVWTLMVTLLVSAKVDHNRFDILKKTNIIRGQFDHNDIFFIIYFFKKKKAILKHEVIFKRYINDPNKKKQ